VGDKSTHGKGTVQTIYMLGKLQRKFPPSYNPGALKVTIRKFYRANGESTQLHGMTPDIVLPSIANEMDIGEGIHEYALRWDTIASADFVKLDRIQPLLEELRRRSESRLAADKDWAYLREDIALYREAQADKSVSLNHATRVKEREESEARTNQRKAERAARVAPDEKVFEISLKLAEQPGLPPPVGATNAPPAKLETATTAKTENAEEAEDQTPAIDVTLQEAKRLLVDLIELTSENGKSPPVASRHQARR
jgi:carboxyl-terminal processing protease